MDDTNWTWHNYLSSRALAQADNVRKQLLRIMERFDLDLTSRRTAGPEFYNNIRKTLVCGFFMQVAHKEGERGAYKTVKDNQVSTGRSATLTLILLTQNLSLCHYIHLAALTAIQNGFYLTSLSLPASRLSEQ